MRALGSTRPEGWAPSEADRDALLRVDRMLSALETLKGAEAADSTFRELIALLESDRPEPSPALN